MCPWASMIMRSPSGAGTAAACWATCSRGRDPADELAGLDRLPGLDEGFCEHAARGRLDLAGRLVGLELEDRLALGHGVADLLEPLEDVGLLHRQAPLRHDDVDHATG